MNETVLEQVVLQAINTLLGNQSTYQAQLQQNIAKVICEEQKTIADGMMRSRASKGATLACQQQGSLR